MISKNLNDFLERAERDVPIVSADLYPKLLILDKFITSGFDYLDHKAREEEPQRLKPKTGADEFNRDWAQWIENYRALTIGMGRQGSTQAYIALEMDPFATLVVFNNEPRPREIMRKNMNSLCEPELRLLDAEEIMRGDLSFNGVPLKDIVIFTDNTHPGVKRRDLIEKLEPYMSSLSWIRVLEIVTA